MIVDGASERGFLEESFDYVIVGSGASGATAARVLADTGGSIAILEEGPAPEERDFEDHRFPALRHLYRDMGAELAQGRSGIPVLQGRCLGGSTVVNSAIMWRLPEDVWDEWARDHGIAEAFPLEDLHRHWDRIERDLSVQATPPSVWGENNRLMEKAGVVMSVSTRPTLRAVDGCHASARCQSGCPFGAKQSMAVTYLPYADRRGAALFTRARADRVLLRGDRAVAVEGRFGARSAGRWRSGFRLWARKAVLVAASAIQTPGLLRRSKVESHHLGAHLQIHPGAMVIGVFEQEVNTWIGATQGFESDEHRRDGRFKVDALALHPELLMASLPGVGGRWLGYLREATHMAIWAVDLRAEGEGEVRDRRWGTTIRFELTPNDVSNLLSGVGFTAEMLFAAGARAVLPGIHGLPETIKAGELHLLRSGPTDPRAYSLITSHLFGTARMSVNPSAGVVGTDLAVHGIRGLYVVDSSVFPSNIGVNPQLSIMGIAMHAATALAERLS